MLNVIEITQKFTCNEQKKRDSNDEISNLIDSFFILNEEGKVWSYRSPKTVFAAFMRERNYVNAIFVSTSKVISVYFIHYI